MKNKKIRIEMKRTLAPTEIPNGTKGWLGASRKGVRGLHLAKFDNGYYAFVFRAEVREV